MKTLIIRVDDSLHARVKEAAWADRRSMQQWVTVLLEKSAPPLPAERKKGKA